MITNPQVGMRVRGRAHAATFFMRGRPGTIKAIVDPQIVDVAFDADAWHYWYCQISDLEPETLSPEEQARQQEEDEKALDQQRRLEHAMKYL